MPNSNSNSNSVLLTEIAGGFTSRVQGNFRFSLALNHEQFLAYAFQFTIHYQS